MTIYFQEARILPSAASPNAVASAASVGALVSSFLNLRPGTRARAFDTTLGGLDCIYLPTLASVTSGMVVTFRQSASGVFTTAVVPNTANQSAAVAVSLHTGAASNYGWFAIAGTVKVKKTAVKVNPNVKMYVSATTGRLMPTAACGKNVLGCISSNSATVASATSTVTVTINYPHMQGPIT